MLSSLLGFFRQDPDKHPVDTLLTQGSATYTCSLLESYVASSNKILITYYSLLPSNARVRKLAVIQSEDGSLWEGRPHKTSPSHGDTLGEAPRKLGIHF